MTDILQAVKEFLASADSDKRRTVMFGGLVLAGCIFVLMPSISLAGLFSRKPEPASRKPSAFGNELRVSPVPYAKPTVTSPPASSGPPNLNGKWQGQITRASNESCTLTLEIRDGQQPTAIAGFSTLACIPLTRPYLAPSQRSLAQMEVAMKAKTFSVSDVFTGKWQQDGSIRFEADKTFASNQIANACPLLSLNVTPFGNGQIAGQFAEGTCGPGGQLILRKTNS